MGQRPRQASFHGRTLKSFETPEFKLSENAYEANLEVPRHLHEHAYLGITIRGTFMEQYGQQSRLCRSGTVVFHPAGEIHSDRFGCSLAHVLNIEINSPKLTSLNQYRAPGNQSIGITGGMASWIGARLYQEFRGADELSGIAIEGLVLQLLAEIFRGNGGTARGRIPCWLEQAREIVHARFTERLTLTDIAITVTHVL